MSSRTGPMLGQARFWCIAAVVGTLVTAGVASGSVGDDSVNLGQVRRQPCTRAGIAAGVMAHFGLLEERRFGAMRTLWLPRSRYRFYAYVLFVSANGRLLRTKLGAEMPALSEQWMSAGGTQTEVVMLDPRVDRKDPRKSAFAVHWIRQTPEGSDVVLGGAKGLWDCGARQLGRLVGSERSVESEEAARTEAAGHCGQRGWTTIRRYGQTAALCRLPRS